MRGRTGGVRRFQGLNEMPRDAIHPACTTAVAVATSR